MKLVDFTDGFYCCQSEIEPTIAPVRTEISTLMSVRTRIASNTDDKGSLLELFSRVVDLEVWSYQTAAACRSPLGSCVLAQI